MLTFSDIEIILFVFAHTFTTSCGLHFFQWTQISMYYYLSSDWRTSLTLLVVKSIIDEFLLFCISGSLYFIFVFAKSNSGWTIDLCNSQARFPVASPTDVDFSDCFLMFKFWLDVFGNNMTQVVGSFSAHHVTKHIMSGYPIMGNAVWLLVKMRPISLFKVGIPCSFAISKQLVRLNVKTVWISYDSRTYHQMILESIVDTWIE